MTTETELLEQILASGNADMMRLALAMQIEKLKYSKSPVVSDAVSNAPTQIVQAPRFRTAPNEADTAACSKCKQEVNISQELGWRKSGKYFYPQPYCKACRNSPLARAAKNQQRRAK